MPAPQCRTQLGGPHSRAMTKGCTWSALAVSLVGSLRLLLLRRRGMFRKLEAQAAGQGCGLDELHLDDVAQLVDRAGAVADHRVALLVVAEVFEAERTRGQQSFRTRLLQTQEEAEARHAGDAAFERGADAILHEGGDVTVGG